MKEIKIWILILTIFFLISSIFGANTQKVITDLKKKQENFDRMTDTLNILDEQNFALKLEKKIEAIVEKVYEKEHKKSDDILLFGQWMVTGLLTLGAVIIALIYFISFRLISRKANKTLKKVIIELTKEIGSAKEDIETIRNQYREFLEKTIKQIENEIPLMMKTAIVKEYYGRASSHINQKNYDLALPLLISLYNSKYRLMDVCHNIGDCFKNIGDKHNALRYLKEAKLHAEEQGIERLVIIFQKEINEIETELD